jgi:hypothetical protein
MKSNVYANMAFNYAMNGINRNQRCAQSNRHNGKTVELLATAKVEPQLGNMIWRLKRVWIRGYYQKSEIVEGNHTIFDAVLYK